MALDEAITHAEDKANSLGSCECSNEHKQLAEWLKELRVYRENDKSHTKGEWL
jgi:hypothetical protein